MPKKFTGEEFINAITDAIIEMNGRFQDKPHLLKKDMLVVGYAALAVTRLETGQKFFHGTTEEENTNQINNFKNPHH